MTILLFQNQIFLYQYSEGVSLTFVLFELPLGKVELFLGPLKVPLKSGDLRSTSGSDGGVQPCAWERDKGGDEAEDKATKERIEREKQEARVGEVQQELQVLVKKHESLELDSKTQGSELAKALENAQHAKAEAQKALQEIEAFKKIAAGKAFIMQNKHVKETFFFLTRVRSSPGAFADLPRSVSDHARRSIC